jgi:hypothetical protein
MPSFNASIFAPFLGSIGGNPILECALQLFNGHAVHRVLRHDKPAHDAMVARLVQQVRDRRSMSSLEEMLDALNLVGDLERGLEEETEEEDTKMDDA